MDGTTAATIPIRDANGRMQAADPASGATDKTLVTANWVSQSGSGAPNNLLHKNGNETFSNIKTGDTTSSILIQSVQSAERKIALIHNNFDYNTPPSINTEGSKYCWRDANNLFLGDIGLAYLSNGTTTIYIRVKNADGTVKVVNLGSGDL